MGLFIMVSLMTIANTDSLLTVLHNLPKGPERIELLNDIAYQLNYSDPHKATTFAKEALSLSKQLSNKPGLARAWRNLAVLRQNNASYDTALIYADSSLKMYQSLDDSNGLAAIYNTIGNISYYRSDFREAINWYEHSYTLYRDLGMTARAGILINNIALAFTEMSNYRQALEYYFEALKLHEEGEDLTGKSLALNNIGIVYFNLGNLDKALEYYHQALSIRDSLNDPFGIASSCSNIGNALGTKGDIQEAMPYFNRALNIFQEKKDRTNQAIVYSQIGHYLLVLEKTNEGISYLKKAIEIHRETGNIQSLGYVLLEYAFVLLKMGKDSQALPYLRECEEIFTATGDINMLSTTYEGYSLYYEHQNQYRHAFGFYKKFNQLQDSLFHLSTKERVASAEWQYISEKEKAENAQLTRDKALSELEAEKHKQIRNILIIAALLLFLIALLIFLRYRLKQRLTALLEMKNSELEMKNQQIERQNRKIESQYLRLRELDEAKTRFFTNISHEFRTPLTLVQGPLEDIIQHQATVALPDELCSKLKLAHRNIRQLTNLTGQLLDLSKLKAGKMKLKTSPCNLITYLHRTINTFESAIPKNKTIHIRFQSDLNALWLYLDQEKLDQIVNNLISNAIKAVDKKGEIVIALTAPSLGDQAEETSGKFAVLTVSDNGKGIAPEDLPRIFNRFFRADAMEYSQVPGTGIGLEITRDLVELHGGSIQVTSVPFHQTTFEIRFPMGTDHLEADEILDPTSYETGIPIPEDAPPTTIHDSRPIILPQSGTPKSGTPPKILLVEDNPEMRQYILGHLIYSFDILEASNGKEALSMLKEEPLPALIISDLMMPEMDGLTLLKEIRNNNNISHIPFILLTARADDEDRIAGYQFKADAYITKPFQAEELLLRIRNMLESQEAIKEKYSRKVMLVEPDQMELTSADKQFLDTMKELVMKHMGDPDFGLQHLSGGAFLSERQLRRKLTELTGLTPIEYIRQIKLLYAKQLIEQQAYNSISEIAVVVGFTSAAYFSRLFKKMFHISPVELLKPE